VVQRIAGQGASLRTGSANGAERKGTCCARPEKQGTKSVFMTIAIADRELTDYLNKTRGL